MLVVIAYVVGEMVQTAVVRPGLLVVLVEKVVFCDKVSSAGM